MSTALWPAPARVIAALLLLLSCLAQAQISDPIPDPVIADGLAVRVLEYVQFPASGSPPAPARINHAHPAPDGSDRLFVNDQRGMLYSVRHGAVTPYLDLPTLRPAFLATYSFGRGFHGFALHPEFAANGLFYTVHLELPAAVPADLVSPLTTTPAAHSVLTEWQASDPAASVFAGSWREVLRIELPTTAHTMQQVAFNPTALMADTDYGLLYIGQGDGARLDANALRLDSPLGKILLIDPAGTDGSNGQYGIVQTNPYAQDGDADTLAEIWASGLRNPHRISWDAGGDHAMLIADIGQNSIEEINIGVAGANYGWIAREGTFLFNPPGQNIFALPADDALNGYSYAVAQYDHDEGNAVAGGYVYRGALIPELQGRYIFGDIVNGRIFHVPVTSLVQGSQAVIHELSLVDAANQPVTLVGLTGGVRADLRFAQDGAGELYVLTKTDGRLRRLVSALAPDSDGDGEPDTSDNCILVANPDQRDSNEDGYGNVCDADLNDDGIVNLFDLVLFKAAFGGSDPDSDFNGDGSINLLDLVAFKAAFALPPGPAA